MENNLSNASRLRNICITVYGYEDHYDQYNHGLREETRIKYFVMGKEVCPGTGSLHLQGYVELSKQLSFIQVRDILLPRTMEGIRGEIQPRKKSALVASNY